MHLCKGDFRLALKQDRQKAREGASQRPTILKKVGEARLGQLHQNKEEPRALALETQYHFREQPRLDHFSNLQRKCHSFNNNPKDPRFSRNTISELSTFIDFLTFFFLTE